MKTKRMKWTMSMLAAALALTTAACGSGSGGDNGGKTADATAAPTAAAATAAPETAKSKPTLKALNIWQKDDYNTYPVAKVIEEKTGYKVQYDMLPQDKPQDKLNLLIASGEAYDAITTGGGSGDLALYADYARKGALLEVTDLIEKYGPNIKASILPQSFEAMKVDGKLYGIPFKGVDFVSSSLMIRQDWLDKLGLKAPTTTDELKEVLKQFKEKDPGGNGDKNAPLTINGGNAFVDSIVGAFGLANGYNDVNGSLVPRVMDPAFKDYIAYMADMYKQGLIDKEFAVNKDATAKEKFTSGRSGVLAVGWFDIPSILDALTKNNPSANAVYLPALKGPSGKYGFAMGSGFDRITYIPKSSKNPEEAIKWMNAKLEKETFKQIAIGEEGKHYTFKDGAYTPILPIFTDERNQANNYLTGVDERNYPTYWQARVRKDPRLFAGYEFLNLKTQADAKQKNILGIAPYLPEYAKNNQQLGTMINDYAVKLIVGAEDLSGLDAFQKKFLSSGGEASMKEIDGWYKTLKK